MKREYERRMRICYERQKEFEVKQKELDFQVGNFPFLGSVIFHSLMYALM